MKYDNKSYVGGLFSPNVPAKFRLTTDVESLNVGVLLARMVGEGRSKILRGNYDEEVVVAFTSLELMISAFPDTAHVFNEAQMLKVICRCKKAEREEGKEKHEVGGPPVEKGWILEDFYKIARESLEKDIGKAGYIYTHCTFHFVMALTKRGTMTDAFLRGRLNRYMLEIGLPELTYDKSALTDFPFNDMMKLDVSGQLLREFGIVKNEAEQLSKDKYYLFAHAGKASNCPNIAYLCLQLATRVMGNMSLSSYRGVGTEGSSQRPITLRLMIDKWVRTYIAHRQAGIPEFPTAYIVEGVTLDRDAIAASNEKFYPSILIFG